MRTIWLGAILLVAATSMPANAGPACGLPGETRAVVWLANGDSRDSLGCHDGMLRNGTTYAAGVRGELDKAFSFDGIDDDVVVPDSDLWTLDTLDFRIDVRVFFGPGALHGSAPGNSCCMLVSADEGGGPQRKWAFYADGGTSPMLGFHVNDAAWLTGFFVTAPFPFVENTWYDVAVQRIDGTYQFWVGSTSIGAVPTTPLPSTTNPTPVPNPAAQLVIGSAEGGGHFAGRIDEVRIVRSVA